MRALAALSGALAVAALGACSGGAGNPSPGGTATVSESATGVRKVPVSANPYTLFETLQVRPLALSPDGQFLYAANTPDNRLEVFRIAGHTLHSVGSVLTGLEPIAVAVRSNGDVWVANHLSDSVSIVQVDHLGVPHLVNTLLVGDEPRDIVFAGPNGSRAFITTAHRGQNSPDDPDLHNPASGRADVWVFDANDPGTGGGQRLAKITLFADTPRALAVSPDGKTVYAAAFFSGDQTTVASEWAVSQVYPNGMPGPGFVTFEGQPLPQPGTGLIVKWKPGPDGNDHWIDAYGGIFDPFITVQLPDLDVFAIDATASPPAQTAAYAHVGTTLFNMAVNPKSGKVYVSNTDAHNDVRFEGHTPGFTSVAGNEVDSRISVIDPSNGGITSTNLNSHLNHAAGTGNPALSLAFPEGVQVSQDGKSLYVIAQGSGKLAVYDTAAIESGSAPPSFQSQVLLSAGGPTGLALDEREGLAYVLTRFDDGISIVDTHARKEVGHVPMFSPEPASVTAGRQYLYDATITSALGDQACASCHIGGDFDGLAWDLGNPGTIPLPITQPAPGQADGVVRTIPLAAVEGLIGKQQADYIMTIYEPCKGPMTTQSLRGLDNQGPMHWRGDRNGSIQQTGVPFLDASGNPVVSAQPNTGIFDEVNGFKSFNVAFPGLVGNAAELSDADMTDFATFMLQASYPPNPIRALDDSLTPTQQAGAAFFTNNANGVELPSDRFHNCNGCHVLDRNGNLGGSKHPGFFGTDGRLSFENETQTFKVPHLRNAYQKVGMFESSLDAVHDVTSTIPPLNPVLPAVRGFGFIHDGTVGKLEDFFSAFVFIQTTVTVDFDGIQNIPPNPYGIPLFNDPTDPTNPASGISVQGLQTRYALSDYVMAFDTNLFPIVGQQITLGPNAPASVTARVALLEAQAALGQTDLVAHGTYLFEDHGFTYSGGKWTPDVSWLPPLTDAQLRGLVLFGPLTFTAVPPGEGWRVGVDRDGDGYVDGDEIALGKNPANPNDHP
ncbi:MAG TPA: beta-propeller fold lactonase family protein [Polyangiaceae bacterium]|jgi:DNA-binding beta-propeller fold protein YncE